MRLDVGCGDHPRGDVNVDSRRTGSRCVFVQADSQFLPFRNDVFSEVYSNYMLPYVRSPSKVLREMIRVSREKVWLKVPHKLSRTSNSQYRKVNPFHPFDVPWFKKRLRDHNIAINVEYEPWIWRIPIPRPAYIFIEIWKKRPR